jgi:hypothetical protein
LGDLPLSYRGSSQWCPGSVIGTIAEAIDFRAVIPFFRLSST